MNELQQIYNSSLDIVEQHLLDKLKPKDIYQLYGLHKQFLNGNNKKSKPSAFADDKTRLAWVSWLKCAGMTQKQCMSKYIKLVDIHLKNHPVKKIVTKDI